VLIFSNTDLPEQEFNAQSEKLRRVAHYDSSTRSWHNQIPLDRPERAAEMLSTLFEAAREHGTTIQVHAQPAGAGSWQA
jgi:predicted TIM-barrel fold metal-dependent hydrolase